MEELQKRNHDVRVIVFRSNPQSGELEVLTIGSVSTDPRSKQKTEKQQKFPGGTNRECLEESVNETRDREFEEETGLRFTHAVQLGEVERLPSHDRYYFLVQHDDCVGTLRTDLLHDNGDVVDPPAFVSFRELALSIYRTHQGAYERAYRAFREAGLI